MAAEAIAQFHEMEWFASRVRASRYVLSEHVVRSLMGGQLAVPDIEAVLLGGHVLEEHRHATRGASYLVCGVSRRRAFHVICADGGDGWLAVTFAYAPAPSLWQTAQRRNSVGVNAMSESYNACYFCGGAMKQITVGNFDYRLEGNLYVIKRVPASLCLQCGEKYIEAEVGHKLNALIEAQQFTSSEQVGVIDFQ